MADEIDRVSIISIGCWKYQYLQPLTGPVQDIETIRDVLVDNPALALFPTSRYLELSNPTSGQMREAINDYVYDRGADNDILLLYFSGHGACIGSSDFGFCTRDTKVLPAGAAILPMTAVRFSEVLSTLWLRKVTPVFIIDSCYSGAAGGTLTVAAKQLMDDLKGEVQRRYAGEYTLLCSAATDQEVLDNPEGQGGFFSHSIAHIAEVGINPANRRAETILLKELYAPLRELSEQAGYESSPMLYLGPTPPEFSIFWNVHYQPLEYSLQPHLVAVLRALWDNGNPCDLSPGEILDRTQLNGAYGNHNKLSFAPWDLVATIPGTKRRQLTLRGVQFMQGNLVVPRDIVLDAGSNQYVARAGSPNVGIANFPLDA